jgi:hypothetical protein
LATLLKASFKPWRLVVSLAIATLVAMALNPIFVTSFLSVWARTVFVGVVLLLAFEVAGHWPLRWVPRWVAQLLAVGLAAPVATSLAYLLIVGGNVREFLQHEGLISGFIYISAVSLVVGLLLLLVGTRYARAFAKQEQVSSASGS